MLDTLETETQSHALSTPLSHAAVGNERQLYRALLMVSDAAALFAAFTLAYWLRFYVEITVAPGIAPSPSVYFPLILVLIPVWLLIFTLLELYDMHLLLGGLREYSRVVTACTHGMMLVIAASFFVRQFDVSRGWLLMAWVLATAIVGVNRLVARRVAWSLRRQGRFLARAVIVGTNAEAHALAAQLRNSVLSGVELVGFVAADSSQPARDRQHARASGAELPVVGSFNAIAQIAAQEQVDEIIVATSALSDVELVTLTQFVTDHPSIELHLSSGLYEVLTTGMRVSTRASVPLVAVSKLRLSRAEAFLKGMLDYCLILLTLPLLVPLFLLLAAIVKFDSPGPVFYRRRMVGVGGREFDAFKFRTMHVDGEARLAQRPDLQQQLAEEHKLKDDPRITRAGRWMRRTSLDEIPQLINVLLGQMSLVGPRMIHPSEAAKYGRLKGNLLSVKPGLTGMWQVSGRSDLNYEERVRLDMVYIRNYSVWLDFQILFMHTLPAVLKGSGAY